MRAHNVHGVSEPSKSSQPITLEGDDSAEGDGTEDEEEVDDQVDGEWW